MVNNSASITTGRDGLIWYGDRSGASGMVRFDPASERWLENVNASDELPIYSIFTGSEGMVWGGMEGRISSINSEGELTVYTNEQLPLPPVPFALYETSDRRLWMIGRIGLVYSVDLSAGGVGDLRATEVSVRIGGWRPVVSGKKPVEWSRMIRARASG